LGINVLLDIFTYNGKIPLLQPHTQKKYKNSYNWENEVGVSMEGGDWMLGLGRKK
jgi:hypothetical protein